ncbi:MAG: hypothetical protein HYV63_19020 [Candidatus Schekmanbacteria bacterium]|nr:hypothetical protein [Candidatus Schekmanbacteria bacterium]
MSDPVSAMSPASLPAISAGGAVLRFDSLRLTARQFEALAEMLQSGGDVQARIVVAANHEMRLKIGSAHLRLPMPQETAYRPGEVLSGTVRLDGDRLEVRLSPQTGSGAPPGVVRPLQRGDLVSVLADLGLPDDSLHLAAAAQLMREGKPLDASSVAGVARGLATVPRAALAQVAAPSQVLRDVGERDQALLGVPAAATAAEVVDSGAQRALGELVALGRQTMQAPPPSASPPLVLSAAERAAGRELQALLALALDSSSPLGGILREIAALLPGGVGGTVTPLPATGPPPAGAPPGWTPFRLPLSETLKEMLRAAIYAEDHAAETPPEIGSSRGAAEAPAATPASGQHPSRVADGGPQSPARDLGFTGAAVETAPEVRDAVRPELPSADRSAPQPEPREMGRALAELAAPRLQAAAAHAVETPTVLQLPLALPALNGIAKGELRVYYRPRGTAAIDPEDVSLVFLLDMSHLGPISVRLDAAGGRAWGSITVDDGQRARFVREHLEPLINRLSTLYPGFSELAVREQSRKSPAVSTPPPAADGSARSAPEPEGSALPGMKRIDVKA